jgi:DnaJ like chaperone protein
MAKFGKWIGAGLGWAFGGPIGAVIGLGVGYIFDVAQQSDAIRGYSSTTTGDFAVSMLVLIAAVMKADNKIMRSELDYTKAFMVRKFGLASANEAIKMLHGLLKQTIPVADICHQIHDRLEYPARLELLHLLYGIALADGHMHTAELNLINQIAYYLDISASDQQSIRSMFVKDNGSAYKILGIDPNASVEVIKKAYRKLAVEFHPDKVSYLGDEFRKDADEKFRKINEAYEKIKKEKGFK